MRTRTVLFTAATTIALSWGTAAGAAQAASTTELVDRAAYATTFEQTAGSLHFAGATRGELGGYLEVVVTAKDGTLPTGSNACEKATVRSVLTLSPGEVLRAKSTGEVCTGFSGDSLTVNGYITKKKQLSYSGTQYAGARLAGDGLVAASVVPGLGGQASFFAPVRWCS